MSDGAGVDHCVVLDVVLGQPGVRALEGEDAFGKFAAEELGGACVEGDDLYLAPVRNFALPFLANQFGDRGSSDENVPTVFDHCLPKGLAERRARIIRSLSEGSNHDARVEQSSLRKSADINHDICRAPPLRR
jgi:hypothetical protein